ncbi:hypothetical protein [Desulfovibrio inopinatus]|uniref:hypothetical protein n=1 Tax=Desulfovibrio inopinatus TaxID=102109 RepID=UPI0012EBDB66|nr:hypothetical protein [Desulfovibrio inopinatus]
MKSSIVMCFILLLMPFSAQASITNGDFETGDTDGWTTIPGGNVEVLESYTFSDGTTVTAYDGNYMAMIGSETSATNYNVFNQMIQSTGSSKRLSFAYNFWSYDYYPWDENAFQVLVNGESVLSLGAGDVDSGSSSISLDTTGWTYVTLDLSDYVGLGNVTIDFMAGDVGDSINRSGVFLDNVSIHATPLPGAVWLFGSAMLGLVGLRQKRAA